MSEMKRTLHRLLAAFSLTAVLLSGCAQPAAPEETPLPPVSAEQAVPETQMPDAQEPAIQIPDTQNEGSFAIHFIDVGQADAALVLCDGETMLIDGGNTEDSSLIYSYLKQHDVSHLDYVVATHGHEDHVGGLSGALNYATAGTAYCSVDRYESSAFRNFAKYLEQQGKEIVIPEPGTAFTLGGAEVEIVGVDSDAEDQNNTSIVLRIVYGETSFLFTGDAEREAEQLILDAGYPLQSTVLKVGHHGSESSTSYRFLREVAPRYAVISVGEGNSYGHPAEAVLSRLQDADAEVFRTDLQGTICCESDGKTVRFTAGGKELAVSKADEDGSEQTASGGTDYIGNISSKKFHYAWCSGAKDMKESNRYYHTGTRDEMLAEGYVPCGICEP